MNPACSTQEKKTHPLELTTAKTHMCSADSIQN